MPIFHFLSAETPLTKRFEAVETGTNGVHKHPYPHVKDFTSEAVECPDLKAFHASIKAHAKRGHCLLKGALTHPLNNESRAGSTQTDALTEWVCLDLDRAPFKTPAAFMKVVELSDVAHIIQYSASQGLPGAVGLSCHIFMLLSHPYHAPYLKTWLMRLNLEVKELRQALALTRSNAFLHWPVDITACQNDKLLYIAPPVVGKGVKYTTRDIEYVPGKLPSLPIERLKAPPLEALKKQATEIISAKRQEQGLDKLRAQTKWVGEYEVQAKPGEAQITGIKHARGYTYLNLNGGDSWGYYHPDDDFELLHNFKGEPSYLMKEILPGYYKDKVATRKREHKTPTADGSVVAAICDRRTGKYWKVEWNPEKYALRLDPAKSELQLEHFLNSFGRSLNGEFIPQWDLVFDPHGDWVVDEENNRINLYVPSAFARLPRKLVTDIPPTIRRIMQHAVGTGEIWEHWLNWVTCIVQLKIKTRTAYGFRGTYGTGKSIITARILGPLLGHRYVAFKRNRELEDKFIGWLEDHLLVSVDEAQVGPNTIKETIHQELKNWITEPTIDIRRMNTDTYNVPSYVNFIFNSNKKDMVQLDSKDRRFNFGEYQPEPLPLIPNMLEKIESELEDFYHYLMGRKADPDYAATIIKNAARDEVVEANMNSIDQITKALVVGDLAYLWESMPDMNLVAELHGANSAYAMSYGVMMKREFDLLRTQGKEAAGIVTYESRLSRDELGVILHYCVGKMPEGPNKMTRLLKHHDIELKRMRRADTVIYGIEVRWQVAKAWLDEHKIEEPKVRLVK